jgi:hypothetical protein
MTEVKTCIYHSSYRDTFGSVGRTGAVGGLKHGLRPPSYGSSLIAITAVKATGYGCSGMHGLYL